MAKMKPGHAASMLLLAITLAAGCGSRLQEVDRGGIEDGLYRNAFLGFSIEVPEDWHVADGPALRRLSAIGTDAVAGDSAELKARFGRSEHATRQLFAFFEHPLGAPVDFNANIAGVAERVDYTPGITRGRDYLFHVRRILESGAMEVSFPEKVRTRTFGGVASISCRWI